MWQVLFNGWASIKKYLTDEIIESVLKKENTSKKNSNTHRNKKKNLNTTNLVSAIFFYHRKNSLLLFSIANVNLLKARAFFKQCSPIGDSSPREDHFSHAVIWQSLNTKTFVKGNSRRKKHEFFFQKMVFLFNTGNGKYDCNNIV